MPTRRQQWITYIAISMPIVFVVGVLVMRTFFYDFYRIPSASMYPSIPDASFVVATKDGFGDYSLMGFRIARGSVTATVARGDIVVHRLPEDPSTLYVKRVVALPGDRIEYVGNRMTINGTPAVYTDERTEQVMMFATETINDVAIPVAWDISRSSTDYSMTVPSEHYVVFGDNRNNARDSRFTGPIPRELLVGRVIKIFAPKDVSPRQ